MIKDRKQVRFLLFFVGVSLAFPAFLAAAPLTNHEKAESMSGASGAGGNKPTSVGAVFDAIGHSISSLFSSSDGAKKGDDKPAGATEAAQPAKAEEQVAKTATSDKIVAKRLDIGADEKATTPPPPYSIYSAPTVAPSAAPEETDEVAREVRPIRKAPKPSVETYLEDNGPVVDIKKPPPLPDTSKLSIGEFDANADVGPDIVVDGKPKPQPEKRKKAAMIPSAAALPKQFIPIFPVGASEDSQEQLLPVASNFEMEADIPETTRAIIFIHDIQRNSAEGVATLMTFAGSGGDEPLPLIMAPQFSLELDIQRFAAHLPNEGRNVARWSMEDPWHFGGESVTRPEQRPISSFTALDILLLYLADRERFPNMDQVIIVGHGLGADFVQRYAVMGNAPDILQKQDILTRFVVANPSSYLYLTGVRPAPKGINFINPDLKSCEKANSYPYGLEKLWAYGKRTGPSAVRLRYPDRRILYLVGEQIKTDNLLDRGCEASLQGADRLERGKNFGRYLSKTFSDLTANNQLFTIVPKAAYDPVAILGSPCATAVMFGVGKCEVKSD